MANPAILKYNPTQRIEYMTQIGRVVSVWISSGRVVDTIIRSMSWSGLRTITPTKNRHIVDKKPYRNIIVKNKNNMNEVKFD